MSDSYVTQRVTSVTNVRGKKYFLRSVRHSDDAKLVNATKRLGAIGASVKIRPEGSRGTDTAEKRKNTLARCFVRRSVRSSFSRDHFAVSSGRSLKLGMFFAGRILTPTTNTVQ